MSTYPITGIQKGWGPAPNQVPLRRELDEWWQSKNENDINQRSLFIYALREFQLIDPADKLSYFQIAGIHGQPLKPWDAGTQQKQDFYCSHGNVLFPTWHRPYLMLYEQRIYELMINVVIPKEFAAADKPAMIKAAETWRLPYWDWAEKKPSWNNSKLPWGPNVPYVVTLPQVEVKSKFGTGVTTVPNPLWKFTVPGGKTFHEVDNTFTPQDGFPYPVCKSTSKQPVVWDPKDPSFETDWVNGEKQNVDKVSLELQGPQTGKLYNNTLPESVYRLFLESGLPTYGDFAHNGFNAGQPAGSYSSLEDVHNKIHMLAGGNGHMSQLSVAAYDPIFWMHHCNVDRIFSIWLDLYPNKFLELAFDPATGKPITFPAEDAPIISPEHPRTQIGPNLPLYPFHKDSKGGTFTSADVRYSHKLGYTYPELQRWLPIYNPGGKFSLDIYQKDLRRKIECAYSTTGKSTLELDNHKEICKYHLSKLSTKALDAEYFPEGLKKLFKKLHEKPIAPLPPPQEVGVQDNWKDNDFVVNVLYERFALNGSPFTIRMFLGPTPADGEPVNFAANPSQVGAVFNFSAPKDGRGLSAVGCANCAKQQTDHQQMTGQVILTDHLVSRVKDLEETSLTKLSKDQVVEYLKTNLHWRITDSCDNLVPREHMPSLKISVAMGTATHYLSENKFSKYENYQILWAVTDGRPACARPEDLGLGVGHTDL